MSAVGTSRRAKAGLAGGLAVLSLAGARLVTATTTAGAGAGSTLQAGMTCSTYSVPGLDVAPVAVSTLADGAPYVLVCVDNHGKQMIDETFVYAATNYPLRQQSRE